MSGHGAALFVSLFGNACTPTCFKAMQCRSFYTAW
jgi:hypothetical protein